MLAKQRHGGGEGTRVLLCDAKMELLGLLTVRLSRPFMSVLRTGRHFTQFSVSSFFSLWHDVNATVISLVFIERGYQSQSALSFDKQKTTYLIGR